MHLSLSSSTPWNASYCLPEGQAIYKVEDTGSAFGPRRYNVLRVVPPVVDPFAEEIEDVHFQDKFDRVGEVEYNHFKPSLVKVDGEVHSITTFFKKGEKARGGLRKCVVFMLAILFEVLNPKLQRSDIPRTGRQRI
jgi:hypothetical protein